MAEPAAQGVVEPAAHSRNVAAEPAALGQRQAGQEDYTTAGTMRGLPSRDTLMHKYLALLAQPNATCPEYEINQSDCLGVGTFSSVYRAVHTASGQAVAIKVFKRQRVPDFTMELTTLRELPPHPNVIELLDVVRVSSSLALVFLRPAATLNQWCAARAPEPEEIASLFRQFVRGLSHVHANAIFHADLKPSNILVTTQGLDENWKTMCDALPDGALTEPDDAPYFSRRARWLHQLAAGVLLQLAGFGCCVCVAPFAGLDEAKTRKEMQTLWYRAPEIILGDGKIELAADVWSAGCILAELAGGSPIFQGRNDGGQIMKIFKQMGTPTAGPLVALRNFPKIRTAFVAQDWPIRLCKSLGFDGVKCLEGCLRLDPQQRLTAEVLAGMPFANPGQMRGGHGAPAGRGERGELFCQDGTVDPSVLAWLRKDPAWEMFKTEDGPGSFTNRQDKVELSFAFDADLFEEGAPPPPKTCNGAPVLGLCPLLRLVAWGEAFKQKTEFGWTSWTPRFGRRWARYRKRNCLTMVCFSWEPLRAVGSTRWPPYRL